MKSRTQQGFFVWSIAVPARSILFTTSTRGCVLCVWSVCVLLSRNDKMEGLRKYGAKMQGYSVAHVKMGMAHQNAKEKKD